MHRCPQCGYKGRPDWPLVLWVIAFIAIYLVWMLGDYQPRDLRWIGIGAFLLFMLGGLRLAIRYPAWPARFHRKSTGPREKVDRKMNSI